MPTEVRNTFEIVITGTQAPYEVTVTGPGAGEPIRSTLPPVDEWLTDDLRAILTEMAEDNSSAQGPEIQQVGNALYTALFSRDIERAFSKAQDSLGSQSLRVRLQIESPELAALPWEAMHNGAAFLAMESETPIVRRFPPAGNDKTPPTLAVKPPLRILFVGASPPGPNLAKIDIRSVEQQLAAALKELEQKRQVLLYRMLNPTLDELQAELLKDYHILVFLGHGAAKDPTKDQETCIYLDGTSPEDLENYPFIRNEPEHRGAREVSSGYGVVEAQDLAAALDGKATRLVFLAACNTAAAGKGGGLLLDSFAQGMASQAPAIVAMQYFIGADNGAKLAEFFLRALAEFRPVDLAMVQARNALKQAGQSTRDHFSPVMYLQANDGALFRKAKNLALYGLAALIPALVILAIILVRVWTDNQEQKALSTAVALTTQAMEEIFPSDPLRGLGQALAAREMVPVNQRGSEDFRAIEKRLRDMVTTGRVAALPAPQNIESIRFVPGSPLLLIGRTTDPSQILDLRQGVIVSLTARHDQPVLLERQTSTPYFFLEYYGDTPSELRRKEDGSLLEDLPEDILSVEASLLASVPFFIVRYFNITELRRAEDASLIRAIDPVEKAVFSTRADFPIFVMQPEGLRPNPAHIRKTADYAFVKLLSDSVRDVYYSPFPTAPLMIVDYYYDRPAEVWSATNDPFLMTTLPDDIYQVFFSPQPTASVFVVSYLEEIGKHDDEIRSLTDGSFVDSLPGGISKVTFSPDAEAGIFILDYGVLDKPSEIRNIKGGQRMRSLPYHVYHADAARLGDESVFIVSYHERSDNGPMLGEVLSVRDGSLIGTLASHGFTPHFASHPSVAVGIIDYWDDDPDEIRLNTDTAERLKGNLKNVYVSEWGSYPYFVLTYENSGGEVVSAIDGNTLITLPGNITGVEFGEVAGASYFLLRYDNKVELWSAEPSPLKLTELGSGFSEIAWSAVPGRAAIRTDDGRAYIIALDWLEGVARETPQNLTGETLLEVACKPFRDGLSAETTPVCLKQ